MDVTRAEVATSAAAGVAGVAGSFAAAGRTPAFVAAPLASALVNAAPGEVTTAVVQNLGEFGHTLALTVALVLSVGVFAAIALGATRVGSRSEVPYTAVLAAGLGGWLFALAVARAPETALWSAVPVGGVVAVAERGFAVGRRRPVSRTRRQTLAAVGALAGFLGVAGYRGRNITGAEPGPISDVTDAETQSEAEQLLGLAAERSLDVPELAPLVTEIGGFYEVDINGVNPNLSDGRWELSVTGAVEESFSLDYAELTEMVESIEHRFVTLRCVGEGLNGKKMDTALWTGVPVSRLLERAGVPESSTCCVMLRAADGYYEEFPLAALEDGFLAFGMNGRRLPRAHGYPVRALVPGHWGEINVKWLTEIEVLKEEQEGYWEKRGWHGTGPVETVAKLHTVEKLDDGKIRLGGHAYAGTRGIQRVEISTDGQATWQDATLSEPLPGEDVWRQWTYEWQAEPGEHEVVVRATDGTGTLQPESFSQPYPSGPTGWVSRTVDN
ncbi:molybdopterin-dependent oxidoreductase [Halorussus halophilus]|uniref:molybdopterin-dependent oxidoreductase n=1 Tax=Halorussus halophilus TaxID=2650975 RepID=UPI0013015B44|nr:molybdopterin-dependent oxidoreductase [Halorussus halophilus]